MEDDAKGDLGALVGAVDQGTATTRFLVFSAKNAELVTYHEVALSSSDRRKPEKLFESVQTCLEQTAKNLEELRVDVADITAVGVANQRETTVAWDRETGAILHDAILWSDVDKTSSLEKRFLIQRRDQDVARVKALSGLPVASQFSALKMRWMLENAPGVSKAASSNRLVFGTIDSWLIWRLTSPAPVHATDVTNASRTGLMNLETLQWDPFLCDFYGVKESTLPEIRSSSEIYGRIASGPLSGTPISGCLGDQQAALLGQNCFTPGKVKSTFGVGAFTLVNIGPRIIHSERGLLSTVAYQLGRDKAPKYALEGVVPIAGAAFEWLADDLEAINGPEQVEKLVADVESESDVHFVPALSGLYSSHWNPDVRGLICGLDTNSTRGHICKASFEAIAFQTKEILEAMKADLDGKVTMEERRLLIDGRMAQNDTLAQIQADLLGVAVIRPSVAETAALGAAIAAGSAERIAVWDTENVGESSKDTFMPRLTEDEREIRFERWKDAVQRSLDWASSKDNAKTASTSSSRLLRSVAPAIYFFTSFLIFKLASNDR